MARGRKEAERIVVEAQEQRDRLLSRTEIVNAAHRDAERIVEEGKERAAKMRLEAEDYIDQKLAAFEILLSKTIGTVARGREQLRGDPAPPEDSQGPAPQEMPFNAEDDRPAVLLDPSRQMSPSNADGLGHRREQDWQVLGKKGDLL